MGLLLLREIAATHRINIRVSSGQSILYIASATPENRSKLLRLEQFDYHSGGGDAITAGEITGAEFADRFAVVNVAEGPRM